MTGRGQRLESFLFTPVNARSVRVLTVLTVVMVIFTFRLWDPYYGRLLLEGFSPLHDIANTYVYRGVLILTGLAFAAGVRPRLTGTLLTVLLAPLLLEATRPQSRQVLMVTLLCLILLDGGKTDRRLPVWPVRLIQLQLSLIYGVNAVAKLTPAYLSGDVLTAMSMTLPNFIADLSDGFYRLGPLAMPAAAAAWGSVIVESFLAVGFWFRPLRWTTAIVGVLFHGQLMTIIHIGMLDWVSMFLYLVFLLPATRRVESP